MIWRYCFSRFQETGEPFFCCGQEICLSMTEKVTKLLDPDVLEVQLSHRYADGEDKNQLKPENYRFMAYRNIFFVIYGRTKKKMARLPLPSCIVMRIRSAYPDPKNCYSGFRSKRQHKKWGFMFQKTKMSDREDIFDDCSPPLEAALRRADSNQSWTPGSQGFVEATGADKDKLFLVSLGALMTLFT